MMTVVDMEKMVKKMQDDAYSVRGIGVFWRLKGVPDDCYDIVTALDTVKAQVNALAGHDDMCPVYDTPTREAMRTIHAKITAVMQAVSYAENDEYDSVVAGDAEAKRLNILRCALRDVRSLVVNADILDATVSKYVVLDGDVYD